VAFAGAALGAVLDLQASAQKASARVKKKRKDFNISDGENFVWAKIGNKVDTPNPAHVLPVRGRGPRVRLTFHLAQYLYLKNGICHLWVKKTNLTR
jgi:hypothetical protein